MTQSAAAAPREGTAPAVRVHTLGRFLVEIDGAPLRFDGKSKRKPLELLKVLVALGGDTVPVEQLIESLWPDADGDRAHSAFTTNLGRLRKLIGAAPLVLQSGRLTLDTTLCWVDTRHFAERLRAALSAADAGDLSAGWAVMQEALALYRGPFLDGEFEPPELLSARERLHGQFLRHIERMGAVLMERGEHGKAVELYRIGLEVDDLAEDLYQQLMRCYLAQGRIAEGISVYRRCKETFRASVGIDPSAQVEALHQQLLAAQSAAPAPAATPAATPQRPAPAPQAVTPAAPSAAPGPPRAATPQRRPAPTLSPDGERRTATIACFDLSGYAEMNARLDPEEAEEILAKLRAQVDGVVRSHDGTLNESLRNEWHALFGVPRAHEDDPVRAVRAALEIRALIQAAGARYEPRIGVPIALGVGIATGVMLLHPRGDASGRFVVTGEPMSIGAELMTQAAPNDILIGPETYRLVTGLYATQRLPPVRLPGRSQPLEAFRITGEAQARTRFEAAAERGLTQFVGRSREMNVLKSCLQRMLQGEGQFVTVIGEPGLGKSRLLHEFQQTLDPDQLLVLECRNQASGADTPYLPFQDGLRRGFRLEAADPPETLLEKVVQNIRAVDPALERYIPFYLYLLSIPSTEHALPDSLSGGELRQALQDAIAAVGIQTTNHRPMVLLFEDWHWADEPSEDALRNLVGLMASHRLLIVVTYRPEYTGRWNNLSYHTNVVLHPLGQEETAEMLRSVLDARTLPDGLAQLVQERTGGNPFFIEEVCNSLREDGSLRVQGGVAVLPDPLEQLTIPDTVQAVISARVDRLGADEQQTLRLASVLGREFSGTLLARIASQDVDLPACLERLKTLELIQQMQVLPAPTYRFKHVLTQVVVYDTLLRQQQRKLHALAGGALETLYPDRLEEHYESLAYHYQRSNQTAKALHYLGLAGEKAAQAYSLEAARSHFRAAIALADAQTDTPELKRTRIDLSLRLSAASQYSPSQAHIALLDRSEAFSRELGDDARLAHVIYWRGRQRYVLGLLRESLAEFEQVGQLAEALGDRDLLARYTGFVGRYCWHAAEYERCIEHLERGAALLGEVGADDDLLYLESMLGTVYAWTGRMEEGIALLQSVIERARAQRNPTRESAATVFLAMVHALRGDWAEATALAKAGHEGAERLANDAIAGMGRWTLGYATFMLGDRDAGLALVADVARWTGEGRPGRMLVFAAWLAEMLALAGRHKEAAAMAKTAVAMPEQIGHRTALSVALRAQALIAAGARTPKWKTALTRLKEATDLAESLGARPELAIGWLQTAEVLQAMGDRKEARAVLARARGLLDELGMTSWQAQAHRLAQVLGKR